MSQRTKILRQQAENSSGREGATTGLADGVGSVDVAADVVNQIVGLGYSTTILPEEGMVRINVDAAFSKDGLHVGIGFGVWMHDGLVARRMQALDHPLAPQSAESYAIRAAVH